ncbi:MAG: hypothetical protein AB8G11_16820 [Saprospiraceae bacterium]
MLYIRKMAEFQAYKFRAVDTPLSSQARKEVGSLSSRSQVSSTSASFVYHYGDFRGNPMNVLRQHFDLYMYFANWGTRQLMIKLPIDAVDYWELKKYEIEASDYATCGISLNKSSKYVIIDIEWNDEEGGGWMDIDDYDLSDFVAIREAILNGDYSALFVYWLKIANMKADPDFEYDEYDEDFQEAETETPPIPSQIIKNQRQLIPFTNFFEIDKDLVGATIQAAKQFGQTTQEIDYSELLQNMNETDKDTFLMQVLDGTPRVDVQLKKYLQQFAKANKTTENTTTLSAIADLQILATEERIAAERAEKARKHRLKIEKTAKDETTIWKSVYFNLDRKTGSSYDLAVGMLVDLKDLAIYRDDLLTFQQKMDDIKDSYGRSKALARRFTNAKL